MEKQKYLISELAQYAHGKNISIQLLAELREWVDNGNTVYDNPWHIADEKGNSMDYLAAREIIFAE